MPAAVGQRLTPKKRAAFLAKLAECGNVVKAAKAIRCTRQILYLHRQQNAAFADAWEQALHIAMDTVLEPEAVRRAVEGVPKPIYHQGKQIGTVREYSDTLLIFLLKGGKPAKYREKFEVGGNPTEPIVMRIIYENAPSLPAPAPEASNASP